MVALALDLSTTTPSIGGGLPVKPDGWYSGMIVDTKSKNARENQKNTYLECTIAYQDGSLFIERFNLWNESADTVRIAKENLAAVCQAMGLGPQIQDSTHLHNRPFDHYLAVEKSTTDAGKAITQNRLKAVRLPDGKVIGNVPPTPVAAAPGAAPPAAPPGPGFAAPAAPPAPAAAPAAAPPQPWGGGAPAAPPAGAPAAPPAPAAPGFGQAPPPAPAPAAPAAPGFAAPPAPGAPQWGGGAPAPGAPWGGPTG